MTTRFLLKAVLWLSAFTLICGSPSNRNPRKGPPPPDQNDSPGPKIPPPDQNDSPGPKIPPPDQNVELGEHKRKSDDLVVVDDMVLNKNRLKHKEDNDDDMVMMKRQPYNDQDYWWPKSGSTVTIPYTYSGVDSAVLQRAIEVFNAKTCIRFTQRSSEANYVNFQSGSSCHALIGNQQIGVQSCDLTSSCASKKGKVLHEMMHIIGFLHEHCRPDRDSYVTIHTDRIKSGAASNFDIFAGKDQGLDYDCDSILQYKSTAFAATSGQETITSTHCSRLGNDDTRLSLLDYKRVNKLYSCDPNPDYKYYTVRVVTNNSWLSGTDCFIYLTLHGSTRTSTEYELDLDTAGSSLSSLFEAGSDNTFQYMAYRNDLGSITGISLRMVSNGSGPAWWPDTITVTDPAASSVTFTNNQWLSPGTNYGTSSFPVQ